MARFFSRLVLIQVGWIAALLVLLVAYGFLCMAAYFGLRDVTTPAIASLICGLVTLVFAIVIAVSTYLIASRSRRRSKRGRGTSSVESGLAAEAGEILGEEVVTLLRSHPQGAVVASLLAGMLVGANPRLRRRLRDFL